MLDLDKLDIKIDKELSYQDKIYFTYNNKKYYYKRVKRINQYYNELIAEKIANRIGIPCCKYYLSQFGDSLGVVSEIVDENYISMEEYLKKHYSNDDKIDKRNNLTDIWYTFLEDYDEKTVYNLMNQLVDIFIFDILLGNIDRHLQNYGLIISKDKVKFYPLFDNTNILSDDSIYYGDYSLQLEREDYYTKYGEVNLVEKFIKLSSKEYINKLKKNLFVITENSIKDIFYELENENIFIEPSIKKEILSKFSDNLNMINSYLKNAKTYTKK